MVISTPFPPKEGIGYYTYNLSQKLIEKGHDVVVITRGSWNNIERQVYNDIEVIRVPFIPVYPFYIYVHGTFVNKLFKSLESQIDIVHIHTPLPPLIKTSLPIITTVHTPMLTDNQYIQVSSIYSLFSKISARFVSYPLELKLIKASDMITTVSNTIAREMKEYGLNPSDISVMYNGVDEKFFYPTQKTSKENGKYIMYVGRIDREKGLFDLVECGRYVCNEMNNVYFILAGNGRDLSRLKQKTKKVGLENKFKFLGQVDKNQLVKLYQNASIFVLPSYHEGLPGVVLEAMSCGLPVITTDVRGNRDLISNGKNGIIVSSRAPKKLADAIISILNDDKMQNTLGKNARKTIEENYTWDIISSKFLGYYKSLIEEYT
jgi:glycosyltransferase involved in cell wall biosynthesis